MGILRGLGSILTAPIRGVRAGGQAVIDIFDSDEDEEQSREKRRKKRDKEPRFSDEEFDAWGRGLLERGYDRDGNYYGGEYGASGDQDRYAREMAQRRAALEMDPRGGRPDPEKYGATGKSDDEFMSEAEARMRQVDAAQKQNILYTLQVLNEQMDTRNEEKARQMAELLKFLEVRAQQRNPFLRQLGAAGTPNEPNSTPMVTMPQRSNF